MNRLYAISGGPGAGKTSLIAELDRRGFVCVPEAARRIIQDQVQSGGNAVPWGDKIAYTRLMLEGSIADYRQFAAGRHTTFFDRGIPDTLCYARLIDLPDQADIQAACRRYRYAVRVFLAPPWEEIYRLDSERRQDFAEAVRTYRVMSKVYEEYGYDITELPKTAPRDRADFVLRLI